MLCMIKKKILWIFQLEACSQAYDIAVMLWREAVDSSPWSAVCFPNYLRLLKPSWDVPYAYLTVLSTTFCNEQIRGTVLSVMVKQKRFKHTISARMRLLIINRNCCEHPVLPAYIRKTKLCIQYHLCDAHKITNHSSCITLQSRCLYGHFRVDGMSKVRAICR